MVLEIGGIAFGILFAVGIAIILGSHGSGQHKTRIGKIGRAIFNLSNIILWFSLAVWGMIGLVSLVGQMYRIAPIWLFLIVGAGMFNFYYRRSNTDKNLDGPA